MISSGSTLAEDIRYALNHWQGLTRFLEDGRLELDTNPVENAIRPVCLTRKNALFAGHEVGAENWALLASIVATCKLNDVNPVAYIAETLGRSSTAIPTAKSKTSCPGDSAKRQASPRRGSAERLRPCGSRGWSARLGEVQEAKHRAQKTRLCPGSRHRRRLAVGHMPIDAPGEVEQVHLIAS